MTVDTVQNLVRVLQKFQILEPERLRDLAALKDRYPDPKGLARALVARGWLTPYQANQIFLGKFADLVLGSYTLLERLGEGGMGTVFKARHRTMARIVALKVIRKERLNHPEAIRRFRREIKAAAQLNHPNIVKAFDADEVGGTHLLVMEFVEGTDLAKVIKQRGWLPVPEACEYTRQTALGLQHAHECGLVHRDIKPFNLLISDPNNQGQNPPGVLVRILDMGLARIEPRGDESQVSTFMTQEGAVMGSPDYIAPEQAMGAHNVDIRADLYSLGCTLYQMLTGQVPFPGGSLGAKLVRHKIEDPEPVERLRAEVSPALAEVVRKLMAKQAADRYQTPAEVATVLGQLISSGFQTPASALRGAAPPTGPVHSAGMETFGTMPPSKTPTRTDTARYARQLQERRRWLLLNTLGGSVLLLFLGVLLFLLTRPTPRPSVADAGAVPTGAVPDDPLAGFVPLFNGKDLDGWEIKAGPMDSWKVQDGLLLSTGTAKSGWISTRKTYRDFALRLEWRVPTGGASSVFLRSPVTGKPAAQALRIQILDDANPGSEKLPERKSGSIYTLVAPTRAPFKGAGEWNLYEIVCRGDRLKLTYNGEEALDVDLTQTAQLAGKSKEGSIALFNQVRPVEFRNLHIKDLLPRSAASP